MKRGKGEENSVLAVRRSEHMLGSECKCIQEVLAFSPRHWTPVARNVAARSQPRCWKRPRDSNDLWIWRENLVEIGRSVSRRMKYRGRETASSARNSLLHAKMQKILYP